MITSKFAFRSTHTENLPREKKITDRCNSSTKTFFLFLLSLAALRFCSRRIWRVLSGFLARLAGGSVPSFSSDFTLSSSFTMLSANDGACCVSAIMSFRVGEVAAGLVTMMRKQSRRGDDGFYGSIAWKMLIWRKSTHECCARRGREREIQRTNPSTEGSSNRY